MLDTLRRGAQGIVAKFLMAVLVLSFGVWGISGFFQGMSDTSVAKVGSEEIPYTRFQTDYQQMLQMAGQRMGQPISPDLAAQLGLPGQALSRLITEALLNEEAKRLGVGVSDQEVADQIRSDPAFAGPSGVFDRARFQQLVGNAGLTEDMFVQSQRALAARRQVVEGLFGDLQVPQVYDEALWDFRFQERSVEAFVLGPNAVPPVAAPTDDELTAFFGTVKARFRAPEFRAVEVMVLDPAKLADPAGVSDADARAAYEAAGARFVEPEQRAVLQIPVADAAMAEKVTAALNAGETPDQVAALVDRAVSDIDLGLVTRGKIVDPVVAEAAFSAAPDSVQTVNGKFGLRVIRVGSVVPEKRTPFESVVDLVKKEVATERARASVRKRLDDIEDARAGGETLAELAQSQNLPLVTITAVDRTGKTPDGTDAAAPGGEALLTAVFQADEDAESAPVLLSDGSYAFFDVTGITAPADRPLEAVRPAVVAAWTAQKTQAELARIAGEAVKRIEGGEAFEAVAGSFGVDVQTVTGLRRATPNEALPQDAVETAFSGPVGTVADAESETGQRVILKVTDVTDPAWFPETDDARRIQDLLAQGIGNTLTMAFLTDLQAQLGVRVNQDMISMVVSGPRQ
ncbi:SurA N-terminal domain-containing protein [Segnochrobactraceae bacterium EtOH-i3]